MNYFLLSRYLGMVCLLIGGSMAFSLPFASPQIANRTYLPPAESFERGGAIGIVVSMAIALSIGAVLYLVGRRRPRTALYRKEAMAVVGLSWVMATVLGAMPFYFSGTRTTEDVRPVTFVESMFESQSGFSTTGATVLTDLETPSSVPHCILFWRSWTHFLGGLGIVVLFVAILGQGSAGKAMMQVEMPGPSKQGSMPRMQHAALSFAAIYVGLNVVLTIVYLIEGMTPFDALCHAFGTMATGGFSTYNASHGRFDSAVIDATTIVFMILAGTNFTLLYLTLIGLRGETNNAGGRVEKQRGFVTRLLGSKLLGDIEFRTYIGIITVVTTAVIVFGMRSNDEGFANLGDSIRYGLFQVVSIITTTGYGTADFDRWNNFGRGALLLLMFVGGCAGSTGGGMKVIRHVLFYKILRLEIERSHRPRIVRTIRVGDSCIDDPQFFNSIVVYFSMVLAIFVASWLLLITFEPASTFGDASIDGDEVVAVEIDEQRGVDMTLGEPATAADGTKRRRFIPAHKLIDSASAVAATLNNIGPGLGVVGATQNYAGFSQPAKLLFTWLMMLGRVEIFSVVVLFSPKFWRRT